MFSTLTVTRLFVGVGTLAATACVGVAARPETAPSTAFYTVTAEIALARHQVRLAALQYAAAVRLDPDPALLARAADVTASCLQPSLTEEVARRWMQVVPTDVEAHRAAARAALELNEIERSAMNYRVVLDSSPRGLAAELAALDTELGATDNIYGARQVADRLAGAYPASSAARRLQGYAALRADDPAAAVQSFAAALATESDPSGRRELTQALWRAEIVAGDKATPLEQARALAAAQGTAESRLDYALLLLAAEDDRAARAEFALLAADPDTRPVALRLTGLVDFQRGDLDEAGAQFAKLATTGRFVDDALYYLGLIAERHADVERALHLYAQVQSGENAVPALLHAAALLRQHGDAASAVEVLGSLIEEEPQRAPDILTAWARMDAAAGDLPSALAVLHGATAEYPDNVMLRYALASVLDEAGKVDDSLRELHRVAVERPTDPAALNAYGFTLADHDRHLREARTLIERAHDASPKSPAILDSLGWVLYRQGHLPEALPYLTAAYADDHDGDIAAHLGEVLWRLDRHGDAERIWSAAARADGDSHLLRATRQRLHGTP